jgi:hypothetical protein
MSSRVNARTRSVQPLRARESPRRVLRERRAPDSLRCVTRAACVPGGSEGVSCVRFEGVGIWMELLGWEVTEGAISEVREGGELLRGVWYRCCRELSRLLDSKVFDVSKSRSDESG